MIFQVLCALALLHCYSTANNTNFDWSEGFEKAGGLNATWDQRLNSWYGNVSNYVRQHSGSTGSSNTGPSSAFAGHNYIYYEDSAGNDDPVYLTSKATYRPSFQADGNCSISYAIHMNGATTESLEVKVVSKVFSYFSWRTFTLGSKKYSGHRGNNWTVEGFNFTVPQNYNGFKIVMMFNGSTGYEGDVALDELRVHCEPLRNSSNPTDAPWPTKAPVTNGTAAPNPYPTGDGEVRVKFGGAQVDLDVPEFTAAGYLGDAAAVRFKFGGAEAQMNVPEFEAVEDLDDLFG